MCSGTETHHKTIQSWDEAANRNPSKQGITSLDKAANTCECHTALSHRPLWVMGDAEMSLGWGGPSPAGLAQHTHGVGKQLEEVNPTGQIRGKSRSPDQISRETKQTFSTDKAAELKNNSLHGRCHCIYEIQHRMNPQPRDRGTCR